MVVSLRMPVDFKQARSCYATMFAPPRRDGILHVANTAVDRLLVERKLKPGEGFLPVWEQREALWVPIGGRGLKSVPNRLCWSRLFVMAIACVALHSMRVRPRYP